MATYCPSGRTSNPSIRVYCFDILCNGARVQARDRRKGELCKTLSPFSVLYDTFYIIDAHQFHWWHADVWNPKYASHVCRVIVAVDVLGNIVWICPLARGASVDVLIWDGYGPSPTRGDFFNFEVGAHDCAYKGRIHVIVPFIGRKNGILTAQRQSYNDVHGWYRAHIEHLFVSLVALGFG